MLLNGQFYFYHSLCGPLQFNLYIRNMICLIRGTWQDPIWNACHFPQIVAT